MIKLGVPDIEERRRLYRLSLDFQRDYCGVGGIGNTWTFENGQDTPEMHIRRRWFGFCGGMLLAEYLDLPWHEGNPDTWNNRNAYGDVGDIEVRTRAKSWHDLTTRSMDQRPQILIKPKINWEINAENWHDIPDLFVFGFHFPFYIRRHGKPLPQEGVFGLPDKKLIPMSYLKDT